MYACLHGAGNLTALAFEFSPMVEQTAEDTVTFDVSGLDRLPWAQDIATAIARRAAELGLKANLALAANPDAAIYAARGFAGVSIVPEGDEAKFLGPLPLSLLDPSPELEETLERWGLRRFQELGALPPLGIAERLGAEGLRLRELARGEAERKLLPIPEPLEFQEEIEPEYPIDLLEPLAFLLARLLHALAMRLAARGLAADEVRLRLKLENRATHECVLRLPVPSLDTKALLKLLQLDLSRHPPLAPVVHIGMDAHAVKPQAAQSGLYVPIAPEPVELELTIARITAIAGEGRAGSAELIDTHRPDAFRMVEFGRAKTQPGLPAQVRLTLRRFRPPLAARVVLVAEQPAFVTAPGIRGKVIERAGPWRASGDWWTAEPWSRDEWDIAVEDGALYRLYCGREGWFVEGNYD